MAKTGPRSFSKEVDLREFTSGMFREVDVVAFW
jgi:hypothetical protein